MDILAFHAIYQGCSINTEKSPITFEQIGLFSQFFHQYKPTKVLLQVYIADRIVTINQFFQQLWNTPCISKSFENMLLQKYYHT